MGVEVGEQEIRKGKQGRLEGLHPKPTPGCARPQPLSIQSISWSEEGLPSPCHTYHCLHHITHWTHSSPSREQRILHLFMSFVFKNTRFGVSFPSQIHTTYVLNIQPETDSKTYRKKNSKWGRVGKCF